MICKYRVNMKHNNVVIQFKILEWRYHGNFIFTFSHLNTGWWEFDQCRKVVQSSHHHYLTDQHFDQYTHMINEIRHIIQCLTVYIRHSKVKIRQNTMWLKSVVIIRYPHLNRTPLKVTDHSVFWQKHSVSTVDSI